MVRQLLVQAHDHVMSYTRLEGRKKEEKIQ
jgi:hypothetical protein